WPARTAANFAAISSTCQFIANGVRGLSSRNARAAKLAKSWCKRAAHSPDAASPATAAAGRVTGVRACEEIGQAPTYLAPLAGRGRNLRVCARVPGEGQTPPR